MKNFLLGTLTILLLVSGYFLYTVSEKNMELQANIGNNGNATQLSGILEELSGLQTENQNLKVILSGQLTSLQNLQHENEILKSDVGKYREMIVNNKLNNKNDETYQRNTMNNSIDAITKDRGYITEVYSNGGKNYLKIDYVDFGTMGPSGADEIINNNPLIRTFEIDSSATFSVYKYINGDTDLSLITFNQFSTRGNGLGNPNPYNPVYYGKGGPNGSIVELEHDSQKAYKITETYRP